MPVVRGQTGSLEAGLAVSVNKGSCVSHHSSDCPCVPQRLSGGGSCQTKACVATGSPMSAQLSLLLVLCPSQDLPPGRVTLKLTEFSYLDIWCSGGKRHS